jgi:hypothetical protein
MKDFFTWMALQEARGDYADTGMPHYSNIPKNRIQRDKDAEAEEAAWKQKTKHHHMGPPDYATQKRLAATRALQPHRDAAYEFKQKYSDPTFLSDGDIKSILDNIDYESLSRDEQKEVEELMKHAKSEKDFYDKLKDIDLVKAWG